METINWSKDNCVCGYWRKDGKYSGAKSHGTDCPNTIHDNTPNVKFLMSIAGRDKNGNSSHRPMV